MLVDGRPLVVCADFSGRDAFSWDPVDDRWAVHPLDNPCGPNEDDMELDCLLSIGALVVDGRIVVGGGGYRQPFAQWDLQTGAVLTYARDEHGGVARTSTMELHGRPLFIAGDSSAGSPVRLWDPSQRDSLTEYEGEDWFAINYLAEPIDVCWHRDSIGGLASGMLGGRPVVISSGADACVMVRDVDDMTSVVQFDDAPVPAGGVGMIPVDGRMRVVAAGGTSVLLGDPDTGTWGECLEFPGDEVDPDEEGILCMDVGVVDGRPIAVTGAKDGTVCLWDLEGRSLLGAPITEHEDEVFAVRMTEVSNRAVALTAGRDRRIRVWDLDDLDQ